MANTIRLKRSSLAGKIPATTDLALGEIAVNTTDGKLYLKKSDGGEFIVEVGPITSVAGRTGAVTLVKADVGLASDDNTSDAAKPVSSAMQTALDTKAPLVSPAFTGTPTAPTQTQGNNSTRLATTAYVDTLGAGKAASSHTHAISDVTNLQTVLDGKAAASHTHTASQLSDSTVAGRALLTAADATAQRAVLGLGTGALRNVAVGTTAPANPAVNDLWVDTN